VSYIKMTFVLEVIIFWNWEYINISYRTGSNQYNTHPFDLTHIGGMSENPLHFFILYIYFKTIVIDNLHLFRKWRGSSPIPPILVKSIVIDNLHLFRKWRGSSPRVLPLDFLIHSFHELTCSLIPWSTCQSIPSILVFFSKCIKD